MQTWKSFWGSKEISETRSFCENCRITDHGLLQEKFNIDTLLEICRSCWLRHQKIKKNYNDDIKENFHFKHFQLIYINNHQKQKKRAHKISNSLCWSRYGCQNWWWPLCLKYYQNLLLLFIFFFCCAKEGRVVGNNESDVATLKILR